MKRILQFIFLILIGIIGIISCKDNEESPSLEVLTQSLSFPTEGGTKSVEVKTNVSGWFVSLPKGQTWLKAKKNGSVVEITAERNLQHGERSANIKVKAGTLVRNIQVQQLGNDASILISQSAISVSEEGEKSHLKSPQTQHTKSFSQKISHGLIQEPLPKSSKVKQNMFIKSK